MTVERLQGAPQILQQQDQMEWMFPTARIRRGARKRLLPWRLGVHKQRPDTNHIGRLLNPEQRVAQERGAEAPTLGGDLVMLREHGGLETAHRLLSGDGGSYRFIELWLMGRSDLIAEALALQPEYANVFRSEELQAARTRLAR